MTTNSEARKRHEEQAHPIAPSFADSILLCRVCAAKLHEALPGLTRMKKIDNELLLEFYYCRIAVCDNCRATIDPFASTGQDPQIV
jgi:hypothetical protein